LRIRTQGVPARVLRGAEFVKTFGLKGIRTVLNTIGLI
jgi:hypothetical protein